MRTELITKLKTNYMQDRIEEVDADFLQFEEDMAKQEDLELILQAVTGKVQTANPYNSIMLYVLGVTNSFDHTKARADTIDGSPPDIDVDFDAVSRDKAIEWVVNKWGRDRVANIITHQTFKPRGLIESFFRVTEGDRRDEAALKKKIPEPVHGKEPSWEKVLEANKYLASSAEYEALRQTASRLYGMVTHFGIHAAGIVISNDPISDTIPTWKNGKSDAITQYDMKEVETLGKIKFDFLGIDNISIYKETIRLVEKNHGIKIDPYKIPDGDARAYTLMHEGLLAGIFQMETSGTARDLIRRAKPTNIEELSDVSSLNRPGPMQAGLHDRYIQNRNDGYAPTDMPTAVAEILKDTSWTLVYQESVMRLATDLAGFTLQEADDVRRAMGKKKAEVLAKWQERFVNGCVSHAGLERQYAQDLWVILAGNPDDPDDNGFADYCLAGDTLVNTNMGMQTIKDIVEQNMPLQVISSDGSVFQVEDIGQWHNRGSKQTYTYKLESGKSVTCTPDHQFMLESGEFATAQEIYEQGLSAKLGPVL